MSRSILLHLFLLTALCPSAVFTEISSEGNAAKAVKNDQKSKNIKCFEGQPTKYYTERPKTRNKGPVKV